MKKAIIDVPEVQSVILSACSVLSVVRRPLRDDIALLLKLLLRPSSEEHEYVGDDGEQGCTDLYNANVE